MRQFDLAGRRADRHARFRFTDQYAMRVGLEIVQGQSVAFAVMIAIWAAPDRQFQNALRTPLRRSCENAFRIITEMPAHPAEVEVVKSACIRSEEHTSELQSLMRISYAV